MGSVASISGGLVAALFLVPVAPVTLADTDNCVSHGEYDQLHGGMSVTQVYNLFDVYGVYDGDGPDNTFKRAYRSCWAPGERKVVVFFNYDSGNSVDWAIRDA